MYEGQLTLKRLGTIRHEQKSLYEGTEGKEKGWRTEAEKSAQEKFLRW